MAEERGAAPEPLSAHRHLELTPLTPTVPSATRAPSPASRGPGVLARSAVLTLGGCALVLLCLLSVGLGSRTIPLDDLVGALLGREATGTEAVVLGLRLPRTLLGVAAGAALGLAGALMQGLTRNPLADPGLLGVNAGAALGIVTAVGLLGISTVYGFVWFAFAGGMVAAIAVHLLGSLGHGGATPVKLALAGAAMTALLTSLASAMVLLDSATLDQYRFWMVGSLVGQDPAQLVPMLPFLVGGAVLGLATAPALNNLALGDDVAAALGRRVQWVRARGGLAVTLLAGSAVALVGPIAFVGLVVPHVVRTLTGPDHRWLLPGSMVLAPCLLLAADILGRVVARPSEIQVGVMVAFVGGPFFIALVRRRRLAEV